MLPVLLHLRGTIASRLPGGLGYGGQQLRLASVGRSPQSECTLPTDVFVKEAAERLDVAPGLLNSILHPDREVTVQLVVPMDSGELEQFTAYRVQHNNTLGPFKGGVIFHPGVDLESMRSLASLNTWKAALMNLPFGGAKGGVAVDPRNLSEREQQKLTRKFVQGLQEVLGPTIDIPSPDIGTDERHMAWMFDQYSKIRGFSPAAVTGKPLWLHGSHGRESAGGRGVAVAAREFGRKTLVTPVKQSTFVIQGFGKLGSWAAHYLSEAGGKVLAVSSDETATFNESGLDITALRHHVQHPAALLAEYRGGQAVSNDSSFLEIPCDFLIAAAVAGTINARVAQRVQCKAIIEAANNAITPEADIILHERGIAVLPDLYTNAGAMVCSFFEWTQNIINLRWEEEDVARKLESHMIEVFRTIHKISSDQRLTLRQSAYNVALQRIAEAQTKRGTA